MCCTGRCGIVIRGGFGDIYARDWGGADGSRKRLQDCCGWSLGVGSGVGGSGTLGWRSEVLLLRLRSEQAGGRMGVRRQAFGCWGASVESELCAVPRGEIPT